MQGRVCFDLGTQIRRSVQQGPFAAVTRDGHACLRPAFHSWVTGPGELAHVATAIPLRNAAASRATEHNRPQRPSSFMALEFGRQVAVDFKADTDLFQLGRNPRHRFLPLCCAPQRSRPCEVPLLTNFAGSRLFAVSDPTATSRDPSWHAARLTLQTRRLR